MWTAISGREKAEKLKRWALDGGFDRAGIARLAPAATGEAFESWLARGDEAEMGYLHRRRPVRLDPRRLFDGARSAVCVALQYHPPAGEEPQGDLWPRVARYARGRDYHNLMLKRLRKLARRLQAHEPSVRTKPYVDTGPVLERDLAAAAGVGVAGKNTMLLHPEAGSYFLLGELLTSLELPADPPLADLCGSCSRCLEACPTGALPEPYRLDSRRCISYWTIEHRGSIPPSVRHQLGDWVFGCDICQEACPVNEVPWRPVDEAFELAGERRTLDLAGLLGLDEASYQGIFRGSAMKRARREGLRRNAAVAMGNSRDARYVAPLGLALAADDPVVRGHAAWALGRIGGSEAATLLLRARAEEADRAVISELEEALSTLEGGPDKAASGSS